MDPGFKSRQTRVRPRVAPDAAAVLVLLKQCERRHWSRVWLSIVGGLLLLPVGPLAINSFIWVSYQGVNVIFRNRFNRHFLFWPNFWIVAAISLPLLFLLAALAGGSPLQAATERSEQSFGWAFGTVPLALLEIGNVGPRLMLSGVRAARARRGLGAVALDRLAGAVVQLGGFAEAVSPSVLVQSGETPDVLERILPVLLYHHVIDISKNGERVWLSSLAKEKLGCG